MTIETKKLFKEAGLNLLISLAIFAVVITFLFCVDLHDTIKPIAIVSGLLGVSYVLTIKNPANYIGFVIGILSSFALGIQFFIGKMYDWTFLYFAVFVPCQIYTLYVWLKGSQTQNSKPFLPSFLGLKKRMLVLLIAVAMIIVDLFVVNLMQGNGLTLKSLQSNGQGIWITLMGATGVASSILANFLLIQKRTDAWIYWVIFSIASVILQLLLKDYVTLTLFVVYTIINANALIAWVKMTPKNNQKV